MGSEITRRTFVKAGSAAALAALGTGAVDCLKKGVYLINFKADYKLACYGGSSAVLELDGTELPASEMTMHEREGNSAGLYLVRAKAGSTLKIKLNDYDKLDSAVFYIVITRYKIKSEE